MRDTEECKSCNISIVVSNNQIDNMLAQLESNTEFLLTDIKTYRERLEKCSICKNLIMGNTCSKCGCIVQIRARLYHKNCPMVNGLW